MQIQRFSKRIAVIATVMLLIAATVAYALRPDVITVDTTAASQSSLRVTVDEDGMTRVKNRFLITAPVAGRLERITLREGSYAARGDIVAWIAPLPLDSASRRMANARLNAALAGEQEATARVQQAIISHELAQRTGERSKRLFDAGAIAPEQYERAVADVRARSRELAAVESRLRSTRAEVSEARAALMPDAGAGAKKISIRAPASGHILRVLESSERVVSPGTPVIQLGDAREIEVVVDVLSSDAVRIRIGDDADIVEWGGEKPLSGHVTAIEPAAFTRTSALGVEEQRVNVVIEVSDPPATLGDGFSVEARIVVWSSPSVLTVPASAVFQRQAKWEVFTIEDGRARRRRVETGHRGAAMVEIVSGLSGGERVILFPSDQIDEGVKVHEHIQD